MNCPKCNFQFRTGDLVCTNCGEILSNADVHKLNDKQSIGLCILAFFFPIVGIIMYFVMKNDKPIKAKGIGIATLASIIIGAISGTLNLLF